MKAEKPPRHKRSLWKTVLLVVVIVFLVLLTALLIYDNSGMAALSRAIKEARAMQGPLTMEELYAASKQWPDEQNGANVLLAIRSSLMTMERRKEPSLDKLPIFGLHQPEPGHRWTEEEHQRVREFLEKHTADLAAIDTVRDYKGGRFPLDLPTNQVDFDLPSFHLFLNATRVKQLQMTERAMRDDTTHLAEDWETLLRLRDLAVEDPVLRRFAWVNLSMDEGFRQLQNVCALTEPDAAQLERIEKLLRALDDPSAHVDGVLRSQRAYFLMLADYLRKEGVGAVNPGWPSGTGLPGVKGVLMHDEAHGLRCLNELIAARQDSQLSEVLDRQHKELGRSNPLHFLYGTVIVPELREWLESNITLTVKARSARVALAAERYRQATGAFPTSLEALVPAYLDKIPSDPFLPGQPLKLRVTAECFLVYSVGKDRVDNGGDGLPPRYGSSGRDTGFVLLVPAERNRPGSENQANGDTRSPASMPATLPDNHTNISFRR